MLCCRCRRSLCMSRTNPGEHAPRRPHLLARALARGAHRARPHSSFRTNQYVSSASSPLPPAPFACPSVAPSFLLPNIHPRRPSFCPSDARKQSSSAREQPYPRSLPPSSRTRPRSSSSRTTLTPSSWETSNATLRATHTSPRPAAPSSVGDTTGGRMSANCCEHSIFLLSNRAPCHRSVLSAPRGMCARKIKTK